MDRFVASPKEQLQVLSFSLSLSLSLSIYLYLSIYLSIYLYIYIYPKIKTAKALHQLYYCCISMHHKINWRIIAGLVCKLTQENVLQKSIFTFV